MLTCVMKQLSSVPEISLFVKKKKKNKLPTSCIILADRQRAAKTLSCRFLEQDQGCHHSTFSPTLLAALALCLFLQQALEEGQFVWMFKAAALTGGGLYEMDQ